MICKPYFKYSTQKQKKGKNIIVFLALVQTHAHERCIDVCANAIWFSKSQQNYIGFTCSHAEKNYKLRTQTYRSNRLLIYSPQNEMML